MNNRLYVGNLSYEVTTDSLRACFAECGNVAEAQIVTERETGRTRGFAFVTMNTAAEATYAVAQLNGSMLDGRAIRVNVAEERLGRRDDRSGPGGHRNW